MIDLTKLTTEQRNLKTMNIDVAAPEEICRLINKEDQTVPQTVKKIIPDIARAITVIAGHLRHGGRLFYLGSGTSGRLGVLDAAECPPTFSTDPELVQGLIAGGTPAIFRAQEGAEDSEDMAAFDLQDAELNKLDVVVGISASGRTPYVIGGLKYAQSIGAFTIALTCTENPETVPFAALSLTAVTGPEVIAGSTRMKAGTAQKLILNMLSTGSMILLGKTYGNLMVDVQCTNRKLEERARHIVSTVTGCTPEEAQDYLDASGGNCKAAILIHRTGLPRPQAEKLLAENGGFLRKALEAFHAGREKDE